MGDCYSSSADGKLPAGNDARPVPLLERTTEPPLSSRVRPKELTAIESGFEYEMGGAEPPQTAAAVTRSRVG